MFPPERARDARVVLVAHVVPAARPEGDEGRERGARHLATRTGLAEVGLRQAADERRQ
jgi:hypothetical protein